jgi:hypothetical protein
VLGEMPVEPLASLEQVYAVDIEARGLAARFIARRGAPSRDGAAQPRVEAP